MKYLPWAAGGLILIAALVTIFVGPGSRHTSLPTELWGDLSRSLGKAEPTPTPNLPGARRQTVFVLEQVSPIVGESNTLVEALGIESPRDRFTTVLPRGTHVPVGRIVTFSTGAEHQKEIRLHVLRGRSEAVPEAHSLGWVRVIDLPPGPKGATQVSVAFQVVDGAIVLAAQNPADGRAYPIEVSEEPPGFRK